MRETTSNTVELSNTILMPVQEDFNNMQSRFGNDG
jgi:hypothetical protein